MRSVSLFIVCCGLAGSAQADSELERLNRTVERLEARVVELEAGEESRERDELRAHANPVSAAPSWVENVRVGGSARINHLNGSSDSQHPNDPFQVFDARLFVDALVSDQVMIGDRPLFSSASVTLEYELIRLGDVENRVGDLYVDFRELLGSSWMNLQAGRFQIPFGEYYRTFGQSYHDQPFISNSVSLIWWWDEGVRLFGSDPSGTFGYVAALTNGEDYFQGEHNADKQWTLKLFANPTEFMQVSASALQSGSIGPSPGTGVSALWFGEGWARPFGQGSAVVNFTDGVPLADGGGKLDDLIAFGGDVTFDFPGSVKLWLSGGRIEIRDAGPRVYDRDLTFWQGEVVIDGSAIAPRLSPYYLALRASGVGTYDSDKGYLLDSRYKSSLGYNMESLEAYSIAVGWPLSPGLVLRAEYTFQDIDLIRGVPNTIRDQARRTDFFGLEVGLDF